MGNSLSIKVFEPDHSIKAAMFIVHGMQEHKERYYAFAEYLRERGIAVICYDLPGHGQSCTKEERGFFGEKHGWTNLVFSALEITFKAKSEYKDVPIIYFGHSMGTMIGRCFLQEYDSLIDGMILSGAPNYNPAAYLGKEIARAAFLARGTHSVTPALVEVAVGSFNKGVENPRTELDWLSVNEKNVDAYIADPDCGFPFTNKGYYDLFNGMTKMHDKNLFKKRNLNLPIYMFAGEEDPCIGGIKGFQSSIQFLKDVGYKNIYPKLYPGLRHETLQEENVEYIYQDIYKWIEKIISAG